MKAAISGIILILLCAAAFAVSVDDFVIGAYSQYQLNRADKTAAVFDTVGAWLQKAGYNTVLYSMKHDEVRQGRLAAALASLKKRGLGSVIDDWAWLDQGPVGATPMAYGNYLKLEAEYILDYEDGKFIPDPLGDAADDSHNIVWRHDTGRRIESGENKYSNGYAWLCDEKENHAAGYATAEPRFRWKPDNRANSRTLGYDLKFFLNAKDNLLYLRVALSFEGTEPGDKVASVALKVLNASLMDSQADFGRYPESSYLELPLKSSLPQLYGTLILNQDYSGVPYDPASGCHIFEYYAEIPAAGTQAFKDAVRSEFFFHINPQVYWFGKGRLALDYLELEDEIHRALGNTSKTPHPFLTRLEERLSQIDTQPGSENILYYYGKDEPFQGQYSAYDKLETRLNRLGKKLITATHLENLGYRKPGGLPDYSHYGLFLRTAKPEVVMLDAYPLQEWGPGPGALIRWNTDFDHPLFVQNKIQSVVLANYRYLASLAKSDPEYKDMKLYYIPQAFGEKVDPVESGEWRYFLPPKSLQKCLQLLPLCYAADGIVDYALCDNPDQSFSAGNRTYKRISPLSHATDYTDLRLRRGSDAYYQLLESNRKVAVYGPILQKLEWLEADSVMVKGTHPSLDLREVKLSALEVLPSGDGYYDGYVQCGYYRNAEGLPSFMLVNRRAVFKLSKTPEVTPLDVDTYFVDYAPQTVRLALGGQRSGSEHFALLDPFSGRLFASVDGAFEVSIAAGDGILLQMVPILPPKVKSSQTFTASEALGGKITLGKKVKLDYKPGSTLRIADGSVITVEKGAELKLGGDTTFGKGVTIILKPGAKFSYDQDRTAFGKDTRIVRKKPCWLKRLFRG
jgi:hypothetical protein